MKKSTLSTAILVGTVIGLAGCRGEDSNIVFADQKSNDRFTEANPHRKHQPNKHIIEDVNRKPGTTSHTEFVKKKAKSEPEKDLNLEEDLDFSGYPRQFVRDRQQNQSNHIGGGNTTKTIPDKVQTVPAEQVSKFKMLTDAGTIQGTAMKVGTTPVTGSVNKGFSVHSLSADDRKRVEKAIENTNKLRKEKGLPPLKVNESLNAYAVVRAQESIKLFDHKRPDGSDIDTGMEFGLRGENIAAGNSDADTTVLEQWKNSSGHYRNIMNPTFKEIGIGYVHDPNSKFGDYWVQIFGSSNAKSKYTFDNSTNRGIVDKSPDVNKILSQINFDKGGKINLGAAKIGTNQASSAYQAGNLKHNIYKKVRVYEEDGYKAFIQDPAGVFSYQTFGEIVDPNNMAVQFVNIGRPTAPSDDANFKAHYSGASLGAINGKEHVYADVTADVDFGKSKTMDLKVINSKRGEQLAVAKELDFSEKLNWQGGKFQGSSSQAQFYGPNGEEIGGNFSRSAGGGSYEGVFGLKKE